MNEKTEFPENFRSYVERTMFAVEANCDERHWLWMDHAAASPSPRCKNPRKWEQISTGCMVTIGSLEKMPCCVQLNWARIDGQFVLFWHQCSRVSDSELAEAWIDRHFPKRWDGGNRKARTDAGNFHHCLHAIDEANSVDSQAKDAGALVTCWSCKGSGVGSAAALNTAGVEIPCFRCNGSGKCPEIMREWEKAGKLLQTARRARVISLRMMAVKLGVSSVQLSNAEIGMIDPAPYSRMMEG